MPGQFLTGLGPVRNGAAGGVRAGEKHEARWEAGSNADRMVVREGFPQEETSEQILEQKSTVSPLLWIVEYVSLGFFFFAISVFLNFSTLRIFSWVTFENPNKTKVPRGHFL